MPTTEMIAMVAVVAAIALVIIHLFRLVSVNIRHRTLRRMIETNPESAERLLDQVREPAVEHDDERLGIILVAIGIAMLGASMTAGSVGGWTDYGIGGALFPLIVGIALWWRHARIERNRRRREQGQ